MSTLDYSIRKLDAFSVIGQHVELTKLQRKNIQISEQFWRAFNANLKKAYLSQSGNWVKYAFMERKGDSLYYYCSIPKRVVVPDGFIKKDIPDLTYLVVEHRGSMDKIYNTYTSLYKEVLPAAGFTPLQEEFLHFERYDYRFHWNSENSIIEIWVPIMS